MRTWLFVFLLALASVLQAAPVDSCRVSAPQEQARLDSLASEIGDGHALNRQLALQLRRTARRLADQSTCRDVRWAAEEIAFDLTDWLERQAAR